MAATATGSSAAPAQHLLQALLAVPHRRRAASGSAGAAALIALLYYLRHYSKTSRVAPASALSTPYATDKLLAAQRELFVPLPDGSRQLLVPDRGGWRIKKVLIRPTKQSTFQAHRKDFTSENTAGSNAFGTPLSTPRLKNEAALPNRGALAKQGQQTAKKVAVNREFLRQLKAIFKIIIPR